MFSKNNPRYFEHNTYIEFSTDVNQTVRWQLGAPYLSGYKIRSFKFINPEQFIMSNNIKDWFIYEFLSRCNMDDFKLEIALSTIPITLRNSIQHYILPKEGSNVL